MSFSEANSFCDFKHIWDSGSVACKFGKKSHDFSASSTRRSRKKTPQFFHQFCSRFHRSLSFLGVGFSSRLAANLLLHAVVRRLGWCLFTWSVKCHSAVPMGWPDSVGNSLAEFNPTWKSREIATERQTANQEFSWMDHDPSTVIGSNDWKEGVLLQGSWWITRVMTPTQTSCTIT